MRRAWASPIAALLVVIAALIGGGAARAAEPSTVDTGAPAFGRSAWTYRDLRDSDGKYEGGYARFDDTSAAQYTGQPHGGYDATTNKCRICHASHRAGGAYYLLRADFEGDACVYCHIGSAHSSKVVYTAGMGGMATMVGHSVGASPRIPDSTVEATLEAQEVTSTDASGNLVTETIYARHADARENRIFRLRRAHGQSEAGVGRQGYLRIGPSALTCLSCHQPHDAPAQVWRPMAFAYGDTRTAGGYKLLRASPSGSIFGTDSLPYGGGGPSSVSYTTEGMKGYKAYTDFATTGLVNADNAIRAPEETLTAGATFGPGLTIWDSPAWRFEATASPGPTRDPASVNQYALSVWCADCHNLDIGYFARGLPPELGVGSAAHAGTPHPAPFVGAANGPGQCYSCHRSGLTPEPTTTAYAPARVACERCHYGTGTFAEDPARDAGDFPHSGETSGVALLGAWSADPSGSIIATPVPAGDSLAVCLRCHVSGAFTHETAPAP